MGYTRGVHGLHWCCTWITLGLYMDYAVVVHELLVKRFKIIMFKLSNIIYYVLLRVHSSKEVTCIRSHQQQSNCHLYT